MTSLKNAYITSGKIFEQVSRLYRPGMLEELRSIGPGEIVVVTGTYDHVEKLLDTLKVPYAVIDRGSIATHNGGRVMLVNCAAYDGSLPAGLKDSVKGFVADGGRLVTTDWSQGLVTNVFPGRLSKVKNTVDDVVEIQCPSEIGRRFIGMNYAQCRPKWWLETSSHVYSIGDGVVPIITSDEMKDRYGQPYVVVGFKEGKGEVLHFISHLELQRTRLKSKEDKGSLDEFLAKMNVDKTPDMDDAKVAELEAAYSTLNTVANLCLRSPVLGGGMKSVLVTTAPGSASQKSQRLL